MIKINIAYIIKGGINMLKKVMHLKAVEVILKATVGAVVGSVFALFMILIFE